MSDGCKIKRWDQLKSRLQNLSAQEVLELLDQQPEITVIDCRQPREFATIRLPQAINIDYLGASFWEELRQLPRDKTYLVYCNSCRRSTRACTLMKNGGFETVYNLDGGLKVWVAELGEKRLVRTEIEP